MEDLKNILESLLFVSKEPLTIENFKKVLQDIDTKEIRDTLAVLSDEYETRKGGFYLKEVAGGFQLRTRPEYKEWIKRLINPNPNRLSKAAMETLAIIAYRQPIIRSDVEHIRGVDSGGIIRVLLEKKLVRVLGRKDIPGRPLIYATTKKFLEIFDLKNLKDLPTPKEIEEFEALSSEEMAATEQLPPLTRESQDETETADTIEEVTPESPLKTGAESPSQEIQAQTEEQLKPEPLVPEDSEIDDQISFAREAQKEDSESLEDLPSENFDDSNQASSTMENQDQMKSAAAVEGLSPESSTVTEEESPSQKFQKQTGKVIYAEDLQTEYPEIDDQESFSGETQIQNKEALKELPPEEFDRNEQTHLKQEGQTGYDRKPK